jgi:hypothetical protein
VVNIAVQLAKLSTAADWSCSVDCCAGADKVCAAATAGPSKSVAAIKPAIACIGVCDLSIDAR